MIESDVLKALQTGIIAAVAASSAPSLKVKPISVTLDLQSDDKWLEIVQIVNNVQNEFWDTGKTYMGIIRLILHWKIDNKGAYEAIQVLESIADQLPKGTVFSHGEASVKLTDEPNFLGPIEQPPEILYPLSLRYNCFKA